jgi:subtilisin family serine protease
MHHRLGTSSRRTLLSQASPRCLGRWPADAGLACIVALCATGCVPTTDDAYAERTALPFASAKTPAARGVAHTVTLLTGDRVLVRPDAQTVTIERAPGRERVRFLTQRFARRPGDSPHLYVIPEDALPLVLAGKADRRLFDVSLLIDSHYDDEHRDNLPVIATYAQKRGQQRAPAVRTLPGDINPRTLRSVNGVSARPHKTRVRDVWGAFAAAHGKRSKHAPSGTDDAIDKIWLDALLQPVLDQSVPQIGAPAAWSLGYRGEGVIVAVLDTGVDSAHPDLADRLVDSRNFTAEPDDDLVGHGTHVASIIVGSGAASEGRYRGVAPGASLLSGKVCEVDGCPESSIIAGMEWAARDGSARIVNLSLGGSDEPGPDPLEEAVDVLTAQYGTLFVIAAGNDGPDQGTVNSPGTAVAALTVGAVDRGDQMAWFSSRGLTVGDYVLKPDLTAPGVDVVAARAVGTELGIPVGDGYVRLSGTSMATPHVVGAAALLMQQHPGWRAAETKAALMGSASYSPDWTTLDQGAGRVDVPSALTTRVIADPPSISFGLARWPHEDDAPITRTVTYRNLGAAAQLELALDVLGPDGSAAAAGMFTVTPASVDLPVGASVSVTLTANTSITGSDGIYSGRLLASAGGDITVGVPLAVSREVESYDLTLRTLDRSGAPSIDWTGGIVGMENRTWQSVEPSAGGGDVTLRLPRGRYAYETFIFSDDPEEPLTRILAPNQQLSADKLLVLDASRATPLTITPPRAGLENLMTEQTWQISAENGGFASGLMGGGVTGTFLYVAEIEPLAPELAAIVSAHWVDSDSARPDSYSGAWTEQGRLPVGPVLAVDKRKQAVVKARYEAPLRSPESPVLVNEVLVGAYAGGMMPVMSSIFATELPCERTEHYYSSQPSVQWLNGMEMHDEEFVEDMILTGVPATYLPRHGYRAQWNQPPFSPVFTEPTSFRDSAYRKGDMLSVWPPMHGDREGHAGFMMTQGQTRLFQNGELIGESESGVGDRFEVSPEPAEYRLEISQSQTMLELTTEQHVSWTFQSVHVDDGERVQLPLLTFGFAPKLDQLGHAPRTPHFRLPLRVSQYGRSGSPDVDRPSVDVSYDDGATWVELRVERAGHDWAAFVNHPRSRDVEYVSLRARAHDRVGNAVEQTVIRAYALEQQPAGPGE